MFAEIVRLFRWLGRELQRMYKDLFKGKHFLASLILSWEHNDWAKRAAEGA